MISDVGLSLPLKRPQYVPAPEVLVSALVWGTGHWAYGDDAIQASRFRGVSAAKPDVLTTAPEDVQEVSDFAGHLRDGGMQTEASDTTLVEAFVNGITGVKSQKAKSVPVSPMTTQLALAQSVRGALGAKNPPDVGGILESMFVLGHNSDSTDTSDSMAGMWVAAADRRLADDPVLRAVDRAMAAASGLVAPAEDPVSQDRVGHSVWAGRLHDTPFGWLHDHWRKITSPEWVDALPPRVWIDWCSTLLRMGIAFGYLFENRWYEAVGRSILTEEDVPPAVLTSGSPLLLWPGSRLPVSSRNVKPEMRRVVANGVLARAVLNEHFDKDFARIALGDALDDVRGDRHVKQSMREALGGRAWPGACKNMYETILYSVQQRVASTEADYYGLLRQHGNRYSVVQPGTEWIAVMASLACDHPGGETHIGKVLSTLAQLGLHPELMELVKALEGAGLAQGSADADHGVRVRSAY